MREHTFIVRINTEQLATDENSTEDMILDSVTHAITESLEFIEPFWRLDNVICESDCVKISDEQNCIGD